MDDIAIAAAAVLDPKGVCATGRELLIQLTSAAGGGQGVMTDDDNAINTTAGSTYLVKTPREAEGYLLSLAIRSLYHSKDYVRAYELSTKSLLILDAHIDECEGKLLAHSVGGMYPLRSRVLRYRSLVGEQLSAVGGGNSGMMEDLAGRYRSAVLVKDGDGICTVLNLMLRDLLERDQGEFGFLCFC